MSDTMWTFKTPVLLGNTFPSTLIRVPVAVLPRTIENLKFALEGADVVYSFWGHQNTLAAASSIAGVDLTPKSERPAITLSENGFPMLDGEEFEVVWVLNPNYVDGYRPAIGSEVQLDKITGWTVLKYMFSRTIQGLAEELDGYESYSRRYPMPMD